MIGPRSSNVKPEPASRSITVRDACTSCSGAAAAIAAAASPAVRRPASRRTRRCARRRGRRCATGAQSPSPTSRTAPRGRDHRRTRPADLAADDSGRPRKNWHSRSKIRRSRSSSARSRRDATAITVASDAVGASRRWPTRQEVFDRPTATRPDRRQTAGDRCPAARRRSRRESATRGSGPPRPCRQRSPVRCITSVGTRIDGSTSRMSISAFMRVSATAAPGLAPMRRYADHHARNAAIVGDRRRAFLEADRAAPLVDDRLAEAIALLERRAPRIVVVPHPARVAADHDQRVGLLRIGRRKQAAERPAFRHAHQHRATAARRLHHRAHIVEPRVERRQFADRHRIGQAGAALVEQDQARASSSGASGTARTTARSRSIRGATPTPSRTRGRSGPSRSPDTRC